MEEQEIPKINDELARKFRKIEADLAARRSAAELFEALFADIETAFGRKAKVNAVTKGIGDAARVISPGMKYRHYAPNGKFVFSCWDNGIVCIYANPYNVWMSTDKSLQAVFAPSPACYNQIGVNALPTLHWPLEGVQSDYQVYNGDLGTYADVGTWNYDWGSSQCGGQDLLHVGLDIRPKIVGNTIGTKVLAAYDGTVILTYNAGRGWGTGLVVEHIDGNGGRFTTTYIHVNPLKGIKAGKPVIKGKQIATIEDISGPHLHFGIRMAPYSVIAQAGALPRVDQGTCSCIYAANGKKYDRPVWPEFFIDPSQVSYTSE